jgi:V/A-type H+-transporting ATPase subunit E
MSLQNLKSTIVENTEQRTEALIKEAKKEVKKTIEDANRRAEDIKNEAMKTKKSELDVMERSELAIEELKWKKKILETKAEILNKIFAEAENKISQMVKKPEYMSFLENTVMEAVMSIPGSEYIIKANRGDSGIIKKNLKKIEDKIKKKKGPKIKIELSSDTINSIGGVLLFNKNMIDYYNNTVEARILQSKMKLRGKMYKELFGGE